MAMTLGEPAGIGPECVAAAWTSLRHEVPLYAVGDHRLLPNIPTRPVSCGEDLAKVSPEALAVFDLPLGAANQAGTLNPQNASAVVATIETAVEHLKAGQASALMTAPIHKANLAEGAGFKFPGHTEFLAHLAGIETAIMMLSSSELNVVPATIHIALADVPAQLSQAKLMGLFHTLSQEMCDKMGIAKPRVAVAGLNPHAGENGHMGREEIDIIIPAITAAQQAGLNITGPHSADTMFHAAARARYDVAVCMYHDQALIPIKTLAFDLGVNVTLGLPFVRTSPDHGTALDIAGQGIASASATIEAVKKAWDMAQRRSRS